MTDRSQILLARILLSLRLYKLAVKPTAATVYCYLRIDLRPLVTHSHAHLSTFLNYPPEGPP